MEHLPSNFCIYNVKNTNAGKNSFMWSGPTPRVNITNPDQLKEIFSKINDFPKINSNPLARILAVGLVTYEGEQWAKHRKIINPAFHQEKLKVINFFICLHKSHWKIPHSLHFSF